MPDLSRINNTMGKFVYYFSNHDNIAISVSGGSDSDIIVHIVATYLREYLPKIHFINVNTGLEYQATKDHLKYLEEHYNIKIERLRGVSVVTSVRKYGVPLLSKTHSHLINAYQRGVKWALTAVDDTEHYSNKKIISLLSNNFRRLLSEVMLRGIRVSDKCCDISKKKPIYDYMKEHKIDLNVVGERKAEGGARALHNSSCFKEKVHGIDKFMPLFFWDDETKAFYKESEGIKYSDCYEVWGMARTGCVGCPFNSKIAQDLRMIEKYEPKLAVGCKAVFGEAYKVIDDCWVRKEKILPDNEKKM